jgi:type II secretory ATPase GspE/PulE/Tfp pilus assembly ATPase PilB-like protein
MKIIKEGKLPEKRVYRKTCPNCQTEYEFEEREAKGISSPKNAFYWSIICPFCKQYNYFNFLDM